MPQASSPTAPTLHLRDQVDSWVLAGDFSPPWWPSNCPRHRWEANTPESLTRTGKLNSDSEYSLRSRLTETHYTRPRSFLGLWISQLDFHSNGQPSFHAQQATLRVEHLSFSMLANPSTLLVCPRRL